MAKRNKSKGQALASASEVEALGGVMEKSVPRTYEGDGPNVWNNIGSFLSDLTGQHVNNRVVGWSEALQQAATVACLDVLAQDIAKAPLVLYRRTPDGGSKVVGPREHPLARLFWLRPNKHMTWNEFVQMLIYHLGLSSNGYLVPRFKRNGEIAGLTPVLPGRVDINVAPSTNELVYRVSPGTAFEEVQLESPGSFILFEDEMIHIKHRFLNGIVGTSTLAVGNKVFSLTDSLHAFGERLFARDGTLRGTFETESTFEQDQYDRLVMSLNMALAKLRDTGFPLVLENGLKFNKISVTPAEAQQKEYWDGQIAETARLFRIPLHKIGHLTAIKYDNMGPMEAAYVNDSLIPRCQAIEERLNVGLLTEEEQLDYYIEFDRKILRRADEKALSEQVTKQWTGGLITQNEAREELGYNPAKNGDVYQMPANTYLIGVDHKVIVAPGGGAAATNPANEGANDPPKE